MTRITALTRTGLLLAALIVLPVGCQKQPAAGASAPAAGAKSATVAVVTETERSRHFLAVQQQLELGGTLYGYADVDGDILKMAGSLQGLADRVAAVQPQAATYLRQDYAAIATTLGLNEIKAVGFSSVPDGQGFFRNRVFVYIPGERRGLLAGLGSQPAPFAHLGLAPTDTDLFSEIDLNLPAVYETVRDLVGKVGGDTSRNAFEEGLKRAGESAALSVYTLINGVKGRAAMVMRLDSNRTFRTAGPQPVVLPGFSLLVCVEGIGGLVEGGLAKAPDLIKVSGPGPVAIYATRQALPFDNLRPVIAVIGTKLYVATSLDFLTECLKASGGLAQSAPFRAALEQTGAEGNGLTYVAPGLFAKIRRIQGLNPNLTAETKSALEVIFSQLPETNRALVSVRSNVKDGILVRSSWNRSLKQDLAMLGVYNPVTIGALAAMAIPAFQNVRNTSQERAVMNNLRQLAAAADQVRLERGVRTVTYKDLVGPNRYIRALTPVMGEDYRTVRLVEGMPLRIQLPNGRTVEYAP
jgi:type IV pilus assembly protein PilA